MSFHTASRWSQQPLSSPSDDAGSLGTSIAAGVILTAVAQLWIVRLRTYDIR